MVASIALAWFALSVAACAAFTLVKRADASR